MITTARLVTKQIDHPELDSDNFEIMYKYLSPILQGFIYSKFTGRKAINTLTPEDVFQETWLRVYRKWDSYIDDAIDVTTRNIKRRSWIYMIARNLIIDNLRREKSVPQFHLLNDTNDMQDIALYSGVDSPDFASYYYHNTFGDVEDNIEHKEMIRYIAPYLKVLLTTEEDKHRFQALMLKYSGWQWSEIAAKFGEPHANENEVHIFMQRTNRWSVTLFKKVREMIDKDEHGE